MRVLLSILLVLSLAGWVASKDPIHLREGTITIEGTSNVHGWTCTTSNITAVGEGDVDSGEIEHLSALTVSVPVARIDCGNRTMNNKLRQALRAPGNPNVRFVLSRSTFGDVRNGRFTVQASGELAIAGRTRPVQFTAQGQVVAGNRFRITGSVPITMSHYGIRPPTAMAGTMRTRDNVTVRFDVTLAR